MARQLLKRPSEPGSTAYASITEVSQTSRIWDLTNGETKMEFRGHEHVVECAVFAPIIAYPAIRELAGVGVSDSHPPQKWRCS